MKHKDMRQILALLNGERQTPRADVGFLIQVVNRPVQIYQHSPEYADKTLN
jgi:hypothetical protein